MIFYSVDMGSPIEDLKAIDKAAEKKSMPPVRYLMMHPGLNLTDSERDTIKAWTSTSLEVLGLKSNSRQQR